MGSITNLNDNTLVKVLLFGDPNYSLKWKTHT